jgi:hypothetical protein
VRTKREKKKENKKERRKERDRKRDKERENARKAIIARRKQEMKEGKKNTVQRMCGWILVYLLTLSQLCGFYSTKWEDYGR